MRVVAQHLEVLVLEVEEGGDGGVQPDAGQGVGRRESWSRAASR